MAYIELTQTVDVEIEVGLHQFDFDDIIEYVQNHDFGVYTMQEIREAIFIGNEEKALDMVSRNLGVDRIFKAVAA